MTVDLVELVEKENGDDEDEMPYFGEEMRCGEWWASSPFGCYPTLTWLTMLSVV